MSRLLRAIRARSTAALRCSTVLTFACVTALTLACSGDGPITPPPPPPPPLLSLGCPAAVTVQSADNNAVVVAFDPPSTSGGTAPVTASCSATSGSPFSVGQNTVTCSATDARGVTATCAFVVNVQPPPRLRFTRFLAFGDSITYGVDSPPLRTASPSFAYPEQLRQLLSARYRFQTVDIRNDGDPGEKAHVGGVRRLRSAINVGRPEVLLLMEGTNDLLDGLRGIEDGIAALRSMIREARALNVQVALATIPPQRGGRRLTAPLVAPFNDRVRTLATEEGVPLIDVFAGMAGDLSLIGEDDLHPTVRGFSVMADIFFQGIRTHFEERPPGAPARRR